MIKLFLATIESMKIKSFWDFMSGEWKGDDFIYRDSGFEEYVWQSYEFGSTFYISQLNINIFKNI